MTSQFNRGPTWLKAPLLRVIASQFIGGALAFGAALGLAAMMGFAAPGLVVLLAQGLLAAWFGHKFGLARWWSPVQVMLPPAAMLASRLPVPPWIFLVIFLVLLFIYWNAAKTRVPFYLTNRTTWRALAELLADKKSGAFVDIGSGIGGALFYLATQRPDLRFTGIESAPLPFGVAWVRLKLLRTPNVELVYGDFWQSDLSLYDVAYAFLSPAPMPNLYTKARAEMKPGSLLISNSFTVPDNPADETLTVDDARMTELHLWRM